MNGGRLSRMDPEGTIQLLTEIVRGVPSLPGAACRGRHELYDELPAGRGPERAAAEQERVAAAVMVCCGCPARSACPESLWPAARRVGTPAWGRTWGRMLSGAAIGGYAPQPGATTCDAAAQVAHC